MEASRAARKPPRRLTLVSGPADRAFEQLYRRHAHDVYQYALALLANPADAEDAAQTAFLNAYRAFQRGERPHKPHNWLIAITHNVCRMRWRQAGARPREVALDDAPEPVANEHERPNLDEVLAALAALSFNQRAALVMRELEGRSYQEIAEVLGLSVSAVEALLFRARRRLKVERKSLGVITTVPLPGTLPSIVGGGGPAAVGGSALGANLVLKAAVVLAVGAVSAGVGYKNADLVTGSSATPRLVYAQPAKASRQASDSSATRRAAKPAPRGSTTRRAAPTTRTATRPETGVAPSQPGAPAAPASSPVIATPVVTPPAPLPQLPSVQVPQLPSATVPTPAVPQLPVPTPQLPPAPALPQLPPLPQLPQQPVAPVLPK